MRWKPHVRFGERAGETDQPNADTAPRLDSTTRYRVLYRRSGNLIVLLHAFEKHTGRVPVGEQRLAARRFEDFKARMDAKPRRRPRAAGHDAPAKTRRSGP